MLLIKIVPRFTTLPQIFSKYTEKDLLCCFLCVLFSFKSLITVHFLQRETPGLITKVMPCGMRLITGSETILEYPLFCTPQGVQLKILISHIVKSVLVLKDLIFFSCCGAGTAADTEYVTQLISSNIGLHSLSTGRQV